MTRKAFATRAGIAVAAMVLTTGFIGGCDDNRTAHNDMTDNRMDRPDYTSNDGTGYAGVSTGGVRDPACGEDKVVYQTYPR